MGNFGGWYPKIMQAYVLRSAVQIFFQTKQYYRAQ